jgi:hypothetical protein
MDFEEDEGDLTNFYEPEAYIPDKEIGEDNIVDKEEGNSFLKILKKPKSLLKLFDRSRATDVLFAVIAVVIVLIAGLVIKNAIYNVNDSNFGNSSYNSNLYSDDDGDAVVTKNDYTIGSTNNNEEDEDSDEEDGDEESVESVSIESLASGFRFRASQGDEIELELSFGTYELFIDDVNSYSIEVSVGNVSDTIDIEDDGKIDVDSDSYYDLLLELIEIVGNDAIIYIEEINEEYTIEEETNESGIVTAYSYDKPKSCTRYDGYINYSYYHILASSSGEILSDTLKYSQQSDYCYKSQNAYKNYYCYENNSWNYDVIYCDSRYEDCISSKCVQTRFEYDIGSSGSPATEYSGSDECYLEIASDDSSENYTFWASTSYDECLDIFVASRGYTTKADFLDFLDYMDLDDGKIGNYFYTPSDIEIYYADSDGNLVNFDTLEDKFNSNSCETIIFSGVEFYCFNSAGSKDDNWDSILELITYLNQFDIDYSDFIDYSSFEFLQEENIIFVDGSNFNLYGGSLSGEGNCDSSYFNYERIDGDNYVFVCSSIFGSSGSSEFSNAILMYKESLEAVSNDEDKCNAVVLEEEYERSLTCDYCDDWRTAVFGIIVADGHTYDTDDRAECQEYDNLQSDEKCSVSDRPSKCDRLCKDWGTTTRIFTDVHDVTHYFINENTVDWDYVNFLYSSSENSDLDCDYREEFWEAAEAARVDIGCEDEEPQDWDAIGAPTC